MLTQEEYTNIAAWQIDNLEKLLAKIKNIPKIVIYNLRYIEYFY